MEILSELTDLSLERNPSLDLKHKSLNLRNGDFELTQRMNSMLTVFFQNVQGFERERAGGARLPFYPLTAQPPTVGTPNGSFHYGGDSGALTPLLPQAHTQFRIGTNDG